ncbi:MAG TPA: phosphatase PAP2 family protein [Thermoanaerobaculia bacterium]|nr:phosphatase PAP2 family protein [Thermoanaerobaculia bacterium]
MSFRELRVEDVLAGTFLGCLVGFVGISSVRASLETLELNFWDICFIVAPAALIALAAAIRFAFRLEGSAAAGPAGGVFRILRDWFPFAFFSFTYEAFGLSVWATLLPHDRDAELLRIDRFFLGETPAVLLQRLAGPLLTDVMTAAYFLHLVLPPFLAWLLYRKQWVVFRQFLLAVLLAGMLGQIGYMLVPAVGPQRAFPELFTTTMTGEVYRPVTNALEALRAPRDVFPSLHVGISTIVLVFSRRRSRRLFLALLPLVLLNWVSTIYLRYHYAVDVLAGWAVAALAIVLARRALQLEEALRGRAGPAPVTPSTPPSPGRGPSS